MTQPIGLFPKNPHYFHYRGMPTVLITSGEHYGAVLNRDFDYVKYLKALSADGLNHTRTFSGFYHEVPGSFSIGNNTMAPAPGSFICPWTRSDVPGAFDGGNKFDLDRWDESYFARLKDFCGRAQELGIVVEFTLFCPFYANPSYTVHWDVCPINGENNVNGVGDVSYDEVYNLKHPELQAYQDALAVKLVEELNGYDNIIYEICNEPWVNNITIEWQYHIADVIAETEAALPKRHLISQNVSNGFWKVENPHPWVSVYNFHYDSPPQAVRVNYCLDKPIGLNETGFAGQGDIVYRRQAWEFILSGGALFNNLDFSFALGFEDGALVPDEGTPGWGSPTLRKQLGALSRFIHSFDLTGMAPGNHLIMGCTTANGSVTMLAEPGKAYAIYIRGSFEVNVAVMAPEGDYTAEWLSPKTGESLKSDTVRHRGDILKLSYSSPRFEEDMAVKILRSE